ncbi:MAG: hypothetical protein ACO1RT_06600 [Planctomycetaceae bacterium]
MEPTPPPTTQPSGRHNRRRVNAVARRRRDPSEISSLAYDSQLVINAAWWRSDYQLEIDA